MSTFERDAFGKAKNWSVTVEVDGERVLCIGNNHLAGASELGPYEATIKDCAEHLLSFIGASQAAEPAYAHEYGRSNGDGSFSVEIVRGEVKPHHSPCKDWPIKPLYTHPAKTEQPSLSDADLLRICHRHAGGYSSGELRIAQFNNDDLLKLARALLAPRQDHINDVVKLVPQRPGSDKDAEIARLNAIINSPQSGDFLRAVSIEAEHQRQRFDNAHDAGKTPADWFWLIGYLAGKALSSHTTGNMEKAEHHIITTAAACLNWHLAMFGKTSMRPGIDVTAAIANGAPT